MHLKKMVMKLKLNWLICSHYHQLKPKVKPQTHKPWVLRPFGPPGEWLDGVDERVCTHIPNPVFLLPWIHFLSSFEGNVLNFVLGSSQALPATPSKTPRNQTISILDTKRANNAGKTSAPTPPWRLKLWILLFLWQRQSWRLLTLILVPQKQEGSIHTPRWIFELYSNPRASCFPIYESSLLLLPRNFKLISNFSVFSDSLISI